MDGDSLGEAADRLADDLNDRFEAGIGKADRLFLEQLLIDAMEDAGTVATAMGHRPSDYEDEDEGFHLFNLWFRKQCLTTLIANRLRRNRDLGDMIGHRPSGPPSLGEGLRTGIARAAYEASIGVSATESGELLE